MAFTRSLCPVVSRERKGDTTWPLSG